MENLPIKTDLSKVPAHITFDQYKELRDKLEKKVYGTTATQQKHKDRDLLLLTLLWETGGRITDICKMTLSMLDFSQKQINLYTRKRKKTISITISSDLLFELSQFVGKYQIKLSDPLIGLTRQRAHQIIKQIGNLINIRLHPHMFRHGLALYLMGKVPTSVISARLGHCNTAITQSLYQKVTPSIQKEFMKNIELR